MAYFVYKQGDKLFLLSEEYSFFGTKRSYWYYDLKNKLRSITGRKGEEPKTPMLFAEIEWMQKHYLPKAQEVNDAEMFW